MNDNKKPILAFCVSNLNKIESEEAKLKLINLFIQNVESLKNLALKVFHGLVMQFRTSSFMIKLRVSILVQFKSKITIIDYRNGIHSIFLI